MISREGGAQNDMGTTYMYKSDTWNNTKYIYTVLQKQYLFIFFSVK